MAASNCSNPSSEYVTAIQVSLPMSMGAVYKPVYTSTLPKKKQAHETTFKN